eukprot:TRINITY_DN2730_c0_g1_i13.p1 TRINITY_DN2730_c0_g1~~TRINITY_DN2730_c0_g1_i13.p1  ORF type:complete len:901 (-),score=322.19 TRINITY_DN2730_c0_g1_i13:247-2805(-)
MESQSLDDFLQDWDNDDDMSGDEGNAEKSVVNDVKENAKDVDKKKKKKEKKKEKKASLKKEEENPPPKKDKKSKKAKASPKDSKEDSEPVGSDADSGSDSESEEKDESGSGAKSQVKYIKSLKDKDPEFYKFLKEEDAELLNFDESSSEDENEGSSDEEGAVHELPDKLEVASDESDYEEEEGDDDGLDDKKKSSSSGKITKEMVDEWSNSLELSPGQNTIATAVEAFRAAVSTVGTGDSEEDQPCKFRVEGSTVFNSVVRMCVVNLCPALKKFLRQGESKEVEKPQRCKKWKRVEKTIRIYLEQLCVLVSRISEPSVAVVLLKHIHQMIPYFQTYAKGEKQLLAKMVKCWSTGEETVRVIALMCIIRIARNSTNNLLEPAVKQMYMSYVKNTKFTSPTTLPLINFMRRSLVEVYGLDHKLAYYQAFIQIRQLAIHLRNAIVHNKKEHIQAVYNWQFVHSLELWGALLGHCSDSQILQPLIYPLTQVVLGAMRLVPSSKYFPLRFHCGNILTNLGLQTSTFIPVLPIYLDVLNTYNFGKKSKKVSMKPLEFACILKVSKSQMLESGFKDTVVEEVYAGIITYLAHHSNRIGFPELVTPLIFQLKSFLKDCKVGNYCKKMKQVLDKVIANQKFIENRRKSVSFGVADHQNIEIWEAQVERDGTPLLAFYKSWKKVADSNKMKRLTQSINMDDYSHIPLLKKNHKKIRMKMDQEPEVSGGGLWSDDGGDSENGGDSGGESDDEERFKLKEERNKDKKKKKVEKKVAKVEKEESDNDENDAESGEEPKDHLEDMEESDDGSDVEDQVTDLKLEDMDGDTDSELEMNDDFGDGGAAESDDDDGSNDDQSGDESDSE